MHQVEKWDSPHKSLQNDGYTPNVNPTLSAVARPDKVKCEPPAYYFEISVPSHHGEQSAAGFAAGRSALSAGPAVEQTAGFLALPGPCQPHLCDHCKLVKQPTETLRASLRQEPTGFLRNVSAFV